MNLRHRLVLRSTPVDKFRGVMHPDLKARLHTVKQKNLWRERRWLLTDEDSGQTLIEDSRHAVLSFIGNDYLNLSTHPQVRLAITEAVQNYGFGSGGSALLGGYHPLAQELEHTVAKWLKRDAAVLMGSGFLANLALGQFLLPPISKRRRSGECGRWFIDHNIHASILDAARLNGQPVHRFRHNDFNHLRQKLDRLADTPSIIVTEGLFSMDGDSPDWLSLIDANRRRALLVVDEAHSLGVIGEQGRGVCARLSQDDLPLVVLPLGKAVGGYGALLCGQQLYIDAAVQLARSYRYSTALPIPVVAGNLAALRILAQADDQRKRLRDNIDHLRQALRQAGISYFGEAHSPICLIPVKDNESALSWRQDLVERRILVGAIRKPTVSRPRLRLSLRSDHRSDDIDRLVECLHQSRGGHIPE